MYKLTEMLLMPNGNTIVHLEYNEGRNSSFDTIELIGDQTKKTDKEVIELCKQAIRDRLNPENAIRSIKEELKDAKLKIDEETAKAKAEMGQQVADAKLELQMLIGELAESLLGGF
ncbi:hypothetical protein [Facklamia miroungae]|uniref:Uncharacterized protein n=1 Tax=Facklamia miroungae TaxID=120956 RepID=A0A1G7P0X0_9LACT|nr:hypothetical protein [Facklamia miroungae]NKZ28543.1 hypothetical protein [Facklamia miroungae]SDF79945.1 hypothetical protein SAMN05421791_10184 [Facklamia miroungae]